MSLLKRNAYLKEVKECLANFPVTAIIGPRQVGKTTLASILREELQAQNEEVHYFDLELPAQLMKLDNPQQALEKLKGLIIIDEIQRRPDLFTLMRVLADRRPLPSRFLILGSASGALLHQSSESLAGRIAYIELGGFGIKEVGVQEQDKLWIRGGFPESFLAKSEEVSFRWRQEFIRTFLERDVAMLGIKMEPMLLWKFWQMAAHYHGQIWNGSEISRSLGINARKIQSYLDLLTGTFMIRLLYPWFENVGKRVVKSPKFYIRDSGILHALLDINNKDRLSVNPKLGASWEGFALEQIIMLSKRERNAFFWKTQRGAEIDLVMVYNGEYWGFEFKYADAPSTTKSMHIAIDDLKLKKLFVVYPGNISYKLTDKIEVIPLSHITKLFD